MKRIFLGAFLGSLATSSLFTIIALWEVNAAPLSYPGQAVLLFLLVWGMNVFYWVVAGGIGSLFMHFLKLKSVKSYILCGLLCALPMALFSLNSREFEYVFTSIIAGPIGGLIVALQLRKTPNNSFKKGRRASHAAP